MSFTRSSAAALVLLYPALAQAQSPLNRQVERFVSVNAPVVAITHVRLVDGTGTPAREDQTIVITGAKISAVGKTGQVAIPQGAQVLDRPGHTVIPGIIGLHDHMYYQQVMTYSYPKLFLAAGVTTIRTTGSRDSYQELNLQRQINNGEVAGPEVFTTGPYLQGAGQGVGWMHPLNNPDEARRMVRYWSEEGVNWFKAYNLITRDELGAAIDEAHQHGIKVTGHLCSVTFREAVALGIDNLEHGLTTDAEFRPGKEPDKCPPGSGDTVYASLDIKSPAVQQTIKDMVSHGTAMTSTLAVEELSRPTRVPHDQRVLEALAPPYADQVKRFYDSAQYRNDSVPRASLKKAMEFEREFVKAGGLLGAGSDPCCLSQIAGYGDQRNYELLVEAGFTPEQAVQIMTANGAQILGIADRTGTVTAGKQADLVVLNGNPVSVPGDIKNVTLVFRRGLGYDPAKLTEAIKGQVGLR
ncbi:MAG: amidohydrolase family protein [Gemmatimonadetes bacterium]|nr:amidohydrolase family protein [Gemmatimonadota bacterium]